MSVQKNDDDDERTTRKNVTLTQRRRRCTQEPNSSRIYMTRHDPQSVEEKIIEQQNESE